MTTPKAVPELSLMLQDLYIKNFGLIHQAELHMPAGLITITGETGAGKSMLLKALAMISGQRAQENLIGLHGNKAEIRACFHLQNNPEAKSWLAMQELALADAEDAEADTCVIRRILQYPGSGKQYINQIPVSLKILQQLSDMLLDIHFQHQHQSLLSQPHQQAFFDAYAGITSQTQTVTQHYKAWKTLQQQLDAQQKKQAEQQYTHELIQHQVAELDALQLSTASIQQLEQQHKELSFAQKLTEYSQEALNLLAKGSAFTDTNPAAVMDARSQIRKAIQLLEKIQDKTDVTGLLQLLHSSTIHLEEAIHELEQRMERFHEDPQQLGQMDQQLEQLHQLARKHKTSLHALPEVHSQLQQKLEELQHHTQNTASIRQELEVVQKQYIVAAEAVRKKRIHKQHQLGQEIIRYLQQLGLAATEFQVVLQDEPKPASHGLESVSFWISTNPGQPLQPLEAVASGGELARISLALQMLKTRISRIPVLVFDEVDVGIGGATAAAVGKMLQKIGQQGQILCITHQAQVAAYGKHHLQAIKKQAIKETGKQVPADTVAEKQQNTNESQFIWLASEQRTYELARMISGMTIDQTTMQHAQNLLNSAQTKEN